MLDYDELERQLNQTSLPYRLKQCSPHHFQIVDGDKPVIDVWPSKDKFLRCHPEPGEKAQVGKIFELINLARSIAGNATPAKSPKREATIRDLAFQMMLLMEEEEIASLKLSVGGELEVSYQTIGEQGIPF